MKRNITNSFITLATAFFLMSGLSACTPSLGSLKSAVTTDASLLRPSRMFMRGMPQGNDSYSQGIRDGCETFMGIVGAGTLRLLPSKIDGFRLSEDKLYARGFSDGASHCTHSLDWDTH